MLNIILLILNLSALLFMVRCFFTDPEEMFFHPLLRKLANLSEPVLLFFKENRILNNRIHPIIPFIAILFIKGLIIEGSTNYNYTASLSTFSVSLYEYITFLVKVLFWSCWLIASSQNYHIHTDVVSLLHTVINKILSSNPVTRKISVRNTPFRAFSMLIIALLVIIMLTAFIQEYYLTGKIPFIPLFLLSVKIIFKAIVESLSFMPFLLFIRIILSWFMPPPTTIFLLLNTVTEPILAPLRRLNLVIGMIDLSPIVAFIILNLIIQILQKVLLSFPI